MNITDEGLDEIEQYANKKRKADVLLLVQVLKEVREVKEMLKQGKNTCNCGNNSTDSASDA